MVHTGSWILGVPNLCTFVTAYATPKSNIQGDLYVRYLARYSYWWWKHTTPKKTKQHSKKWLWDIYTLLADNVGTTLSEEVWRHLVSSRVSAAFSSWHHDVDGIQRSLTCRNQYTFLFQSFQCGTSNFCTLVHLRRRCTLAITHDQSCGDRTPEAPNIQYLPLTT